MKKNVWIFAILTVIGTMLSIGSIGHCADSVGPVKLTAGYADIWADHDRADDYLFDVAFRVNKYHLITVGAERLSRVFEGGPNAVLLTDNRFALGDTWVMSKHLYWDNNFTTAGDHPSFLPQLSYQTVPHYVLNGGSELSLGLKYARYPGSDVETVSPGYLFPASDTLLFGITGNGIWTHHALASGYVFAQDKFAKRHTIRFTFAGGQSVEGINLEGHFTSYALNYKYRFARRWWIEPYGEIYHGDIRKQNTVGVFLEWCPL